jgi:MFS family permease
MLLLSQAGTLLGFVVMALAPSLKWLFLARAIDGSTAGNLSLAQAYISDHTKPEDRTKAFALIGIAFGNGFFFGPAVSGWLVKYGIATPIWFAALLSLTSIIATATLLPNKEPPRVEDSPEAPQGPGGTRLGLFDWGAYVDFFKRPVLAGVLVQFFLYIFAFSTFNAGFALFAERRFTWHGLPFTTREIGFVFAYAGFLGIVLQGGAIRVLSKRLGEAPLVWTGFVSLIIGYGVLADAHGIRILILAATITAYGTSAVRPALTTLVTRAARRDEQGVVLGLNQSMNSLAQIAAPPLAGLLIDRGWLAGWAPVASAAALLGLVGVRWGSGRVARVSLKTS